jgi:hypothetical protein
MMERKGTRKTKKRPYPRKMMERKGHTGKAGKGHTPEK